MIELSSDSSADESEIADVAALDVDSSTSQEVMPLTSVSYAIEDEPFSIRSIVIEEFHMVQGQVIKVPDHRPARDMVFSEVPTKRGSIKCIFMVRNFNTLITSLIRC